MVVTTVIMAGKKAIHSGWPAGREKRLAHRAKAAKVWLAQPKYPDDLELTKFNARRDREHGNDQDVAVVSCLWEVEVIRQH